MDTRFLVDMDKSPFISVTGNGCCELPCCGTSLTAILWHPRIFVIVLNTDDQRNHVYVRRTVCSLEIAPCHNPIHPLMECSDKRIDGQRYNLIQFPMCREFDCAGIVQAVRKWVNSDSKGKSVEEVKIGFIGCGGNANGHLQHLSNMENVQIVATCDIEATRASSCAASYNANPYTDHKKMLEREILDAVYISLPVFAHGQPELDVIECKLPFFVEKPVAINMEIANEIEKAVAAASLITCVGYQLRYLGSTQLARQILDSNMVSIVVGKYWSGTGRGASGSWLHQMSMSGGQLVEQATHTIDMMRYLVGEVEAVYAIQTNRILKDIDCPDNNCVTLKFKNGAIGSLTASWSYDPSDWSHANVLDILYDDRFMHWDADNLQVKEHGKLVSKRARGPSIDEVFVDAVYTCDSSRILSPYSDAVKSLEISLAANQSAQEGVPVQL